MKRLLLITLVSITLLSCSKDDDNQERECIGKVVSMGGSGNGIYYWANIINDEGEEEKKYLDLQPYNCYARALENGDDCYRGRYWDCDLD